MASPAETLRTERLVLRRFVPDDDADLEFALELHANPDLARFIPSAVLTTREDAAAWLRRIDGNTAPGRGWWCVEAEGAPVAAILLKPLPFSAGHTNATTEDVEIGWRATSTATGHGYVTEAARAVLDAALAGGLDRVVAVTDPANVASRRVTERLGMTHLGRTERYYDESLELFVARSDRSA